jgi:8-oxo-dGTP diphosphatase
MKILLVSAVALIDPDGRVLLARRPEGKSLAGLWEFPGGKVEPHETPETALIRELKEELDIDTWASCLAPLTFASHTYDDFHLLMPLYACRRWQGTPSRDRGADPGLDRAEPAARLPDAARRPAADPDPARLALTSASRGGAHGRGEDEGERRAGRNENAGPMARRNS